MGGNCGSRGAHNPNAKLSESDVYFIRKCYNEKLITQKEAYNVVKDKISFSTFQSIWQGKNWSNIMPEVYTKENKKYYSKVAGIKVNSKLSEEQIMEIRKKYADGATAKELYKKYKDCIKYSSFQAILCGKTHTNLPYFHKKNNRWIIPGEQPIKNKNRVINKCGRNIAKTYSDEEVLSFRKQYVTQNYKAIYENSDKRITEESFQKMLSGRTYTDVPVYSKKQKKWIYK